MLRGLVERRVAKRVPFKSELKIKFEEGGQKLVEATANDVSAGGMQFSVPWGIELCHEGQLIELIFKLPVIGDTVVKAEICYLKYGIDHNQNRLTFYGAKFIDLSMETWNFIVDYCREHDKPNEIKTTLRPEAERKDFRVTAEIPAQIELDDSRSFHSLVEDISYGGIKLRTPVPVVVDSNITLKIMLTEGSLTITGACAWSGPFNLDTKDYTSGIFFEQLDSERFNQLRELIFNLAQSQK